MPEHRLLRPSTFLSIVSIGAVAGVIVLSAGPLDRSSTLPRPARPDPPLSAPQRTGGPVHPVPERPVRALPQLDRSDEPVRAALAKVPGTEALLPLLAPDGIIRRIVGAVDSAARDETAALAARAFARNEASVRAVEAMDAKRLVALYGRLYPLFQQAYAERGNPDGHFNDAMVRAIDNLLRSPQADAVRFGAKLREVRGLLALHGPPSRGQPPLESLRE